MLPAGERSCCARGLILEIYRRVATILAISPAEIG